MIHITATSESKLTAMEKTEGTIRSKDAFTEQNLLNRFLSQLHTGCTVRGRDQGRDKHIAAASERAAKYPTEDQCAEHEGHGEA